MNWLSSAGRALRALGDAVRTAARRCIRTSYSPQTATVHQFPSLGFLAANRDSSASPVKNPTRRQPNRSVITPIQRTTAKTADSATMASQRRESQRRTGQTA